MKMIDNEPGIFSKMLVVMVGRGSKVIKRSVIFLSISSQKYVSSRISTRDMTRRILELLAASNSSCNRKRYMVNNIRQSE